MWEPGLRVSMPLIERESPKVAALRRLPHSQQADSNKIKLRWNIWHFGNSFFCNARPVKPVKLRRSNNNRVRC